MESRIGDKRKQAYRPVMMVCHKLRSLTGTTLCTQGPEKRTTTQQVHRYKSNQKKYKTFVKKIIKFYYKTKI